MGDALVQKKAPIGATQILLSLRKIEIKESRPLNLRLRSSRFLQFGFGGGVWKEGLERCRRRVGEG